MAYHFGYVYIMLYEREETGERLFKFGVSNAPERRHKQVRRALPKGEVYLQAVFPVFSPYIMESKVHKWLKPYKQVPQDAKAGAGKDEFFDLPARHLLLLYLWSIAKSGIMWAAPFAAVFMVLLASGHAEKIVYAVVVYLHS